MKTIRLGIIGITGRMGREVLSLAGDAGFEVTVGLARGAADAGPTCLVVDRVQSMAADRVDIVIDFSLPKITAEVAAWCATNQIPLVSGVTGLSEGAHAALQRAAKATAVIWSPNMSWGVAVLAQMLKSFELLAGGCEFQIEELHHKGKKDRPSGTALFLQSKLSEVTGSSLPAPVSIRGGGIFGIHRIFAMGEEETLVVEHTAMNRRVFARGALRAAKWLVGRNPGLYAMDDVVLG